MPYEPGDVVSETHKGRFGYVYRITFTVAAVVDGEVVPVEGSLVMEEVEKGYWWAPLAITIGHWLGRW